MIEVRWNSLQIGQRYYFKYQDDLGREDPNYNRNNPNLNINLRIGTFSGFSRGQENAIFGYLIDNITFPNEPQLPVIPNFEYDISDGILHFYTTENTRGVARHREAPSRGIIAKNSKESRGTTRHREAPSRGTRAAGVKINKRKTMRLKRRKSIRKKNY